MRNLGPITDPKDIPTKEYVDNAIAAHSPEGGGGAKEYVQLVEPVTITEEDIAVAGEEGITIITIGDENLDLSQYNDILLGVTVPANSDLNTGNGQIHVAITKTPTNYGSLYSDAHQLMRVQSTSLSPRSVFQTGRTTKTIIRSVWSGNSFLYGQMMVNGYGLSLGYPTGQEAWTSVSATKNDKKYFHVRAAVSSSVNFKFPANTTVQLYAR